MSVLVVRFFTSRIEFFGYRIERQKKTEEALTGLVLCAGWILLGWCSQLDYVVLVSGKQPLWIDLSTVLFPFSIFGPIALLCLLPGSVRTLSIEQSNELDFNKLSLNWLDKDVQNQAPRFRTDKTPTKTVKAVDSSLTVSGSYKKEIKSFWNRYVAPNLSTLEEFDLVKVVEDILVMLDIHGGVPSVRKKDQKDRIKEDDQFDALSKVPLVIHSLNVAKNSIRLVEERFPENTSLHLPTLLVASLGHDIGKLEIISGQKYVTGQHPIDGAKYIQDHLMAGHPWSQKVSELIRRHHEAVLDRTPVDLAILIRADKKAREEELKASGNTEIYEPVKEKNGSFPPKTQALPKEFPVEEIFERLRKVTNVILPNRTWVSFSQPDGVVYIQAETLHETISQIAQEAGFGDAFFHATDRENKKSCLQSFYEEFRRMGWVPEKLVGSGFYGNFFWVWNPVSRQKIRTFYVPIKASAFKADPAHLEAERKSHAILASIKVLGVAIPGKQV